MELKSKKISEIKKELIQVCGDVVSFDLFSNERSCSILDEYIREHSAETFISFLLSLNNKDLTNLCRLDMSIVGLIYKDHVIDYKSVVNESYIKLYTGKMGLKHYLKNHKCSERIGITNEMMLKINTIALYPLLSKEIIKDICNNKIKRVAGAILCSVAESLTKTVKDTYTELDVYITRLEKNVYPTLYDDEVKSTLNLITSNFDLTNILESIRDMLYDEKQYKLIVEIWERLNIIGDKNTKTPCLRKIDFENITGVHRRYFSLSGNKWKKLFDKYAQAPYKTCAQIDYEGELFSYVKKYWDSKACAKYGMNGLIKTITDLKELFKLGMDQFIEKRKLRLR